MQGFNMGRYVPPDLEGRVSANAASGKGHALGSRARKLKSEGILTVRFECPFAIWCTTCRPEELIAQGVRFNAEKKKVGNYFSTPIWEFRFKHTVCGGWLSVRTDPKSAEYVVTEGGRRRDLGTTPGYDAEIGPGGGVATEEQKDRLEKDGGFGAVEKKVADRTAAETQKARLEELMHVSRRDWDDPYERSRALRREFRVGRRKRQADERTGQALKDKFGLALEMEVLPERDEDNERVKFLEFGDQSRPEEETLSTTKPMFGPDYPVGGGGAEVSKSASSSGKLKSKTDRKEKLGSALRANSRTAVDPFLRDEHLWEPKVKRKRQDGQPEPEREEETKAVKVDGGTTTTTAVALVGYDSDSS
jgi:coiled-coil domain-containing protein 130